MPTRSGKTYTVDVQIIKTIDFISSTTIDDSSQFTNFHLLYYAGLYQKLFNNVGRQTLAIYNIDNYKDDTEKLEKLNELEKLIKKLKL